MSDANQNYLAWIYRAEQDLHSMETLLASNADFDNICFLAQPASRDEAFLAKAMALEIVSEIRKYIPSPTT